MSIESNGLQRTGGKTVRLMTSPEGDFVNAVSSAILNINSIEVQPCGSMWEVVDGRRGDSGWQQEREL